MLPVADGDIFVPNYFDYLTITGKHYHRALRILHLH
jgi:hypothetical protein